MKTASLLSELARVVIHERLLLEEVFELHQTVSALEVQTKKKRNKSANIFLLLYHLKSLIDPRWYQSKWSIRSSV